MRRLLTAVVSLSCCAVIIVGCGGGSGGGSGSGNVLPQPAFTVTPTSGAAPLSVTFDGSSSHDDDGSITTYAWSFGDGTPDAVRSRVSHVYSGAGNFELRNAGGGNLNVVSVTSNQPWLRAASFTVDADGLGIHRVTVDRTQVGSDGTYAGIVSITSTANPIDISVVIQKFTVSPTANAGLHYLLLIDVASGLIANSTAVSAVDGEYDYTFNNVGAGQYRIYAGSDSDNDALICDAGEACGAFRTRDAPEILNVNGDRDGLDFISGFPVNLFNSSVVSAPVRQRSFDIGRVPVNPSKEAHAQ